MPADHLTHDTVELLQAAIRNQCVNTGAAESGAEVRSSDLIQGYLEGAGLDFQRVEPAPGDGYAALWRYLNETAVLRKRENVVPTLAGVRRVTLQEGVEGLEFSMNGGGRKLADFPAASISDGTLRALGVLLALFQVQRGGPGVPLVAIEEPEVALHPAAAGILLSSLVEAAENKQVIVTSHSPDLLDNPALDAASVLAVEAVDGATAIAHLGEAERSVLKDRLYTVGELLRLNQLSPAP